jgi:GMP synthase-like glutamine amidotransferase
VIAGGAGRAFAGAEDSGLLIPRAGVTLAAPLVRLARSRLGEYEAIRHQGRFVYGLQFHPEASGEAGLAILGNFVGLCSDPPADESPTSSLEGSR